MFIKDNKDVFEEICNLKDAIALENTNYTQKSKIAGRWKKIYNAMKEEKTPFTVAELNIKGNDIIDEIPNIKIERIGELLDYCLDYCLIHPKCNDKVFLISKIKKIIQKNQEYYTAL